MLVYPALPLRIGYLGLDPPKKLNRPIISEGVFIVGVFSNVGNGCGVWYEMHCSNLKRYSSVKLPISDRFFAKNLK